MVAKHYGKSYSNQTLREKSFITHSGVSMLGISEAAESIGFRTMGIKIVLKQLLEIKLPAILHWNQNHFVEIVLTNGLITTYKKNDLIYLICKGRQILLQMIFHCWNDWFYQ